MFEKAWNYLFGLITTSLMVYLVWRLMQGAQVYQLVVGLLLVDIALTFVSIGTYSDKKRFLRMSKEADEARLESAKLSAELSKTKTELASAKAELSQQYIEKLRRPEVIYPQGARS